jgi:glycosyltransferase involved in cell wall biosynthesis
MTGRRDRVCVFAPTAGGGHARYAWELTRALALHPRGGYEFELVGTRELDPQFRTDAYPVHAVLPPLRDYDSFRTRLGWVLNRISYYPRREWNFLRWLRARPDVAAVHLQEWKPWLAAPVLRRIRGMGKRSFYTVHNVLPHKYPPLMPKRLINRWIRRACMECDGLFVHSQRLAGELERFLGPDHPPITIVPHGVWTVPDAPAEPPPVAERLRWKRLLFFGAIRRNKGLGLLLQAAERLPGYRITVAGEPVERAYFEDEVRPRVEALRERGVELELHARFVPDGEVAALFASHSAIVLPYTKQFVAQSGVVFMALAYGLPVVASTAGGLDDLLGEYTIGRTFDGTSPQDLAAAVRGLHEGSDAAGLERNIVAARARYTWHAAAGATLAGYSAPEAAPQVRKHTNDCRLGTSAVH